MPALTISAVNPATDELTIVAHGINTGDGFLAIYTPTPTGAIPGGLAAVTYYWAIRTGANTLKLADSSANALANTAINITDAGGGTLQLLQGLPYCVPRVADGQIRSADDNALWASLVALWNLFTGQAQAVWSAIRFAVPVAPNHGNVVKPFALDTGDLIFTSGGTGLAVVAPTIAVGSVLGFGGDAWFKLLPPVTTDRLQQVVVWAHDGDSTATMAVYSSDESGVPAVVVSSSIGVASGGFAPVTIPITTPSTAAGREYMLRVQAGATDVHMSKGEATYDAPDS